MNNEEKNLGGVAVKSPRPAPGTDRVSKQPDGYWLAMATAMTEAMRDDLHPDLTEDRREVIVKYLGGILDEAYSMGIGLGALQERYAIRP